MAHDVAHAITKAVNHHAGRLRALHASLADYDPSRGWLDLGVARPPAAERYVRDGGWRR